jgi:hypothetical protein
MMLTPPLNQQVKYGVIHRLAVCPLLHRTHSRAPVFFSGGQDSALPCLGTIPLCPRGISGFDYGQRHKIELECRSRFISRLRGLFPDWPAKLGDDHLLDLCLVGQISDTALTADKAIEYERSGLPNRHNSLAGSSRRDHEAEGFYAGPVLAASIDQCRDKDCMSAGADLFPAIGLRDEASLRARIGGAPSAP